MVSKTEYDAVVVGSGPNGFAAAITMQQAGLSVLLIEGNKETGGGMRSAGLTLPGYLHDVCSAIHPMATLSPFFKGIPLHCHGLHFINPPIAAAHPFDNGTAAILDHSLNRTASLLKEDETAYQDLMRSLVEDFPALLPEILGPFPMPKNPLALVKFGLKAITSASWLSHKFKTPEARALWAGMAAHSMQPLTNLTTSAIGLVLMAAAHVGNWPIPTGGSRAIASALESYFLSLGGKIETGFYVRNIDELPASKAVLLDVTPKQLLQIGGEKLSSAYKAKLRRYRYGMGIFKIDWALDEPVPFTAEACRTAGTVHLGNTIEEIVTSEKLTAEGGHVANPFVLFAQPSIFDSTRAPQGKHTAWAYCHVPNGSTKDMTLAIENQVSRFAPGFRDVIKARNTMTTGDMEAYNPNYIGGDINGGVQDIWQLYTRPVLSLSPYRTSAKGIFLCSSSTPPGGGVHGMSGYHAAKTALKDIFNIG